MTLDTAPRCRIGLTFIACCAIATACSSGSSHRSSSPAPVASSAATTTATAARPSSVPSRRLTTTTAAAPGPCANGSHASNQPGADASTPGDIPDSQAFVSFTSSPPRYSVEVPEGWARTDAPNHVHFNQKLVDIDIRLVAASSAPTTGSVQAGDVGALLRSSQCVKIGTVTSVSRRSGPAIRVAYQADSAPDAVTGKQVRDDVERYTFWRAGTEAVITLAAPAGSDNVDVWRRITDSFSWR